MNGLGGRLQVPLLCGVWLLAGAASAEGPSDSPMGQGQANINVRADIKVSIHGTRATPAERVQQLSDAVSAQLSPMRSCYYDLVAKRPTSVGALAIRVTLDPGAGAPNLELKETGGTEPDLTKCVRKALEHASFRKVTRPAAAIVTLEFDNTRARGQEMMEQRSAEADKLDVRERSGGGFEASWNSMDGKVSFTAGSADSREAVASALRALRDSYAGFADCRRRCQKGGLSPAGELQVKLQLQRGGKVHADVGTSTVAHKRAVPCVERALKRLKVADAPAGKLVDVKIEFHD